MRIIADIGIKQIIVGDMIVFVFDPPASFKVRLMYPKNAIADLCAGGVRDDPFERQEDGTFVMNFAYYIGVECPT